MDKILENLKDEIQEGWNAPDSTKTMKEIINDKENLNKE